MMPGPQLYPVAGGAPVALDRDSLTVGRLPANDLQLDDPMVSRHHARLERQGATVVVHDLGSANGTFVNERRIEGSAPLRDGDSVRFGNSTFALRGLPPAETRIFPPPSQAGGPNPAAPGPAMPSAPSPQGVPRPYAPPPPGIPSPYSPSVPPPSMPPPSGVPGAIPGAPPGPYPHQPVGNPSPGPAPAGYPQPGPNYAPPGQAPYAPGIGQAALEPPGEPPIVLMQPQVVFGRDPACDFVFADPAVAPRHALIGQQGNEYFLMDAGSPTGTFVNGRRVTAPHALQSGDQISIGRSTFIFRRPTPPAQPGYPFPGAPSGMR